jgi:hypothetical protein
MKPRSTERRSRSTRYPRWEWLINRPFPQCKALRLLSPPVRRVYERFFTGGLILASMMEDLP